MDKKQILNYLSRVITLEKTSSVQENIIKYTEEQIKQLEYDYDLDGFIEEQKSTKDLVDEILLGFHAKNMPVMGKLKKIFFEKDNIISYLFFLAIASVFAGIVGYIIGYFAGVKNIISVYTLSSIGIACSIITLLAMHMYWEDTEDRFCYVDEVMILISILQLAASIFLKVKFQYPFIKTYILITLSTCFIFLIVRNYRMTKYNEGVQKQYRKDIHKFKKKKTIIDKQIEDLNIFLTQCKKNYSSTQTTLNKLYNMNNIDKDFRGIIPASSFYQYFKLEICDSFVGSNGAYKLYLADLKYERIINELTVIRENIEAIRYNQTVLYDAIISIDSNSKKIQNYIQEVCENQNSILENQHIIAYNTYNVKCNTEILKWMRVMSSI